MVNRLFKRHRDYLDNVRDKVGSWVNEHTVFRAVSYNKDTGEYLMKSVGVERSPGFSTYEWYFKRPGKRWIQVGLGYKNKRRQVCTK